MNKSSDTPKTGKDKAMGAEIPAKANATGEKPVEIGGRGGLDPVRYGDWEVGGKCTDF